MGPVLQNGFPEVALVHVPGWIGYMPFLSASIVSFVASYFATRLGARWVLTEPPPSQDAHWTARARYFYPLRVYHVLSTIGLVLVTGVGVSLRLDGVFSEIDLPDLVLVGMAWGLVGCFLAAAQSNRRHGLPQSTLRQTLRHHLIPLFIFAPGLAVAFLYFVVSSSCKEIPTSLLWIGGALLVLWVSTIGAVPLLRWMGIARNADRRLLRIVHTGCEKMGLAPPEVCLLRWDAANAVAFPLSRTIGVTRRLQTVLDDEELICICMHEIAHLTEPACVKMMRVAVNLKYPLGVLLIVPLSSAFDLFGALAVVVCLFFAGDLVKWRLVKMEVRADKMCAAHQGTNGTYGAALAKLHESDLIPAVFGEKHGSHPDLYERMLQAGTSPNFEKPAPPQKGPVTRGVAVALLSGALLSCLLVVPVSAVMPEYLGKYPTGEAMVGLDIRSRSDQ